MDTSIQIAGKEPSFTDTDMVGVGLFDLITGGMYSDPLVLYREYIQNAADAIEMLPNPQEGKIEIEIDAVGGKVKIRDNGPGLSHHQAIKALIPISKSNKDNKRNRGFRGIGRMCGFAFAKSVSFRTRTNSDSAVTLVVWDGEALRSCIGQDFSITDTVARCVKVEQLVMQDAPVNFFEVELTGFSRQAAVALNCLAVRDYISEIGPVPFSKDFPYRTEVTKLFEEQQNRLEVAIHIIDKTREPYLSNTLISKPHSDKVLFRDCKASRFMEIENVRVPSQYGEGLAAVGWIAHTDYLGALPRSLGVRCLRARIGNIQIGDEYVFDHLFVEPRFNRWCIGEIHILDSDIVPNGGRDYFELNAHLRNLENHLHQVCQNIERQCRSVSRRRNQLKKVNSLSEDVETVVFLASSGYLSNAAVERLVSQQKKKIITASQTSSIKESVAYQDQLDLLQSKLDCIQVNPYNKLAGMSSDEQEVYRSVFLAVAEVSPSLSKARETIESIMKFYEEGKLITS